MKLSIDLALKKKCPSVALGSVTARVRTSDSPLELLGELGRGYGGANVGVGRQLRHGDGLDLPDHLGVPVTAAAPMIQTVLARTVHAGPEQPIGRRVRREYQAGN